MAGAQLEDRPLSTQSAFSLRTEPSLQHLKTVTARTHGTLRRSAQKKARKHIVNTSFHGSAGIGAARTVRRSISAQTAGRSSAPLCPSLVSAPLRRDPGWGERIRRERKQYFTTSSSFLTAAVPRQRAMHFLPFFPFSSSLFLP